jgi:hypothetical protein
VETYGLLPTNHFGAMKQRFAKQSLLLLQECIYTAWRGKKAVSLVGFDVKGAYNRIYKDRLLQRLAARGFPSVLVNWINAFCSRCIATIVVNGQVSEASELEQAGLPQGSPLSPILFIFFNADLVQQRINENGGAIRSGRWLHGLGGRQDRRGEEISSAEVGTSKDKQGWGGLILAKVK